MRKATDKEKADYAAAGGMYPLHSVATIDGKTVYIEDLRGSWSAPDPLWEVRTPDGYHFGNGEMTHGLLMATQVEVKSWLKELALEPCTPGCGCGCDYDEEIEP